MFVEGIVPTLQDIALTKIAIELADNPDLKRKILLISDTIDDLSEDNQLYITQQWKNVIRKKARKLMKKIGVPKKVRRRVTSIVFQIGMRLLSWSIYHEGLLGFSTDISFKVLSKSLFTPQGTLDNRKAAEKLMKEESLDSTQKFNLACLYCLTDYICKRKMTTEEDGTFSDSTDRCIQQPHIVTFWNYSMRGKVDQLTRDTDIDVYRLMTATECGSTAAVDYCFEMASSLREDAILNAAMLAIHKREMVEGDYVFEVFLMEQTQDLDWAPSDFYADVLCLLLSKMKEQAKKELLRRDIEDGGNFYNLSRVLEYFLNWPYQEYFVKTAALTWDFLPGTSYAFLLLKICYKIDAREREFQKSECLPDVLHRLSQYQFDENDAGGETYDHRGLLEQFWIESPEHLKRHVFLTLDGTDRRFGNINFGAEMFLHLLTVKRPAKRDEKLIRLILGDASEDEKLEVCKITCIHLISKGEWDIVTSFIENCLSINFRNVFKGVLSFTKEAREICIHSALNEDWDRADCYIEWSSLSGNEIVRLKKEMAYSEEGRNVYQHLKMCRGQKAVDRWLRWHFTSEEEISEFKTVFNYN